MVDCDLGFPGSSAGKEPACNAGDPGLIPVLGRSPGEGNGNSLQNYCLDNPKDRGAWWAMIHGIPKSWDMTEQLTVHYSQSVQSLSRVQLFATP